MSKVILFACLRSQPIERLQPLLAAKRLGLEVAVTSQFVPQWAKNYVSYHIAASPLKPEEWKSAVRKFHAEKPLSGILTWTDRDVEVVSQMCDELGLAGLHPMAARNARNKYEMRIALNKAGVCPPFALVTRTQDLVNAVASIGTPGVLKPVGASGSKAIFIIEECAELSQTFEKMIAVTDPKSDNMYAQYPLQYIYEGFLDGPELCVDGVIQNGEVIFAGMCDKAVTPIHSLEYAVFTPTRLSEHRTDIFRAVANGISAMGLDNCSFHAEGRLTKDGFRILEIAARPGGGYVSSHLYELSRKFPFHENAIKVACRIPVSSVSAHREEMENTLSAGSYFVIPPKTGVVKKVSGIAEALETDGILFAIPQVETGERVFAPPDGYGSPMVAIVGVAPCRDSLDASFKRALEALYVEVE
jgi:formate-dependent phosphoribosylglycinamide formyltransferase (GAR transformylase)